MADDLKKSKIKHWAFLHKQSRYRARNEDCIFPSTQDDFTVFNKNQDSLVFMICDGVSGGVKGDLASQTVCQIFPRAVFEAQVSSRNDIGTDTGEREILKQALVVTEKEMDRLVAENPKREGMSTTLSYLNLKEGKAVVAWVGDSKVYQIRTIKADEEEGLVVNATEEHTLANQFYQEGRISKKEKEEHPYKKMNIRAVEGTCSHAVIDIRIWDDIREGDFFFLCSDGILDGFLREQDLVDLVASTVLSMDEKLKIVDKVCKENSKGNYSMCLIKVGEETAATIVASPTVNVLETVSKASVIPVVEPVAKKIKEDEDDVLDVLVPVLVIGILLVVAFMIWRYASGAQLPDYDIVPEMELPKVRMEPNPISPKEAPKKKNPINNKEETAIEETNPADLVAGKPTIPTEYNEETVTIIDDDFTEKSPEPLPEKIEKPKKPKISPLKKALSKYSEHHLLMDNCYKVKKGDSWEVIHWNKKEMKAVIPAALNFTEILDPVNFHGKYISRVKKYGKYGYVLLLGNTYKLLKGRDGFSFNIYENAPPKFGSSLCDKYTQVRKIDYAQDGVIMLHNDNTLGYTSIAAAAKLCAN
jgi:serine/threonine protein phosphatase PrpC